MSTELYKSTIYHVCNFPEWKWKPFYTSIESAFTFKTVDEAITHFRDSDELRLIADGRHTIGSLHILDSEDSLVAYKLFNNDDWVKLTGTERFRVEISTLHYARDEYGDKIERNSVQEFCAKFDDLQTAIDFFASSEILDELTGEKSVTGIKIFNSKDLLISMRGEQGGWLGPIIDPVERARVVVEIAELRLEAGVEGGWDNYCTAEGLRNRANKLQVQLSIVSVSGVTQTDANDVNSAPIRISSRGPRP